MKHLKWRNSQLLLSMFSLLALSTFLLIGPITAQAATYYVSLSGNDANLGTSTSAPFRTFAKSVKALRAGDTLYIRGGTWTEQLNLMINNTSGTATSYIKIAGYPGEVVTLRYADSTTPGYGPIKSWNTPAYLIFENLIVDGINSTNTTGWAIRGGNHHFILRNLEIKNFKANGLYIEANDIQVINCKIHDQVSLSGQAGERWYGIYFRKGLNGKIQGNKIYNNPGGGLHFYPGPISNLEVSGNAVYSNNKLASSPVGGIILFGTSSSPISNTRVFNNLVYRNGTSSSGSATGIRLAYTNGVKVFNNTIYGNKTYGIQVDSSSTNAIIQNDISYSNSGGNYTNTGSGTIYTNNITTDPGFVDAAASNFQLRSGSPAVNKGVYLSAVPIDYKNTPRPRGTTHDIGGYEQ